MRHRRYVARVLDRPELVEAVAGHATLPDGFGRGYSERCIEWPWTLSRLQPGALLDAGGTLNHGFVLASIPPAVAPITVMSVSPEPDLGDARVQYRRADLREIPVPDASFDTVACLSTLEHVGMDISRYTSGVPSSAEPHAEVLRVVDELWRVLRPGGRLLLSVPVGAPQVFGSARHVSEAEVADMLARVEGDATTHVFGYSSAGWQPSSWEAVAAKRYRDRAAEPIARDRAPAARALACVEVRRP